MWRMRMPKEECQSQPAGQARSGELVVSRKRIKKVLKKTPKGMKTRIAMRSNGPQKFNLSTGGISVSNNPGISWCRLHRCLCRIDAHWHKKVGWSQTFAHFLDAFKDTVCHLSLKLSASLVSKFCNYFSSAPDRSPGSSSSSQFNDLIITWFLVDVSNSHWIFK